MPPKKPEVTHVYFLQNIQVFLNYVNKITCEEYELSIEGNLLYVFNTITLKTCAIPLTNVASMDLK